MKRIILFLSLLVILLFVLYDGFVAKKNYPNYYPAPNFYCRTRFAAITLPPLGVFVCDAYKDNQAIRRHELIHWAQYHQLGSIGFYANYLWGWITSGFNYKNNPMEKEAYESKGTAL